MASISTCPNGNRRILFINAAGERKQFRIGKMPLKAATSIRIKVEHLVSASISGHALDDETARWVASLDAKLRDKLAAVGLIAPLEKATLQAFLDGYIAKRTDVKGSTAIVYGHTRRTLIDFFGPDKPLREITPGDADDWRLSLKSAKSEGEPLSDNTIRRRSGIAKQFFHAAIRKGLIPSNPFADLKAVVHANRERDYFLSRADAAKIIEACPDAQWRLIFALSRYAGLRCPSEHVSLRWSDVDWERGRMLVRSPKTAHHEGGESRLVPLFPELLPFLEECFNQFEREHHRPPAGTENVITRYRDATQNLRTTFEKIIRRAGLKPWPKLFHNLRATRQTELEENFPSHVVCAWLGNSPRVARVHYLQVTDEHFERAIAADEKSAQKAAHTAAESEEMARKPEGIENENTPVLQGCVSPSHYLSECQLGDEGLEPPTSTV